MTSIVLAGGHSSRLGREKSRELVAGESLIDRVIGRLRQMSAEILIVISARQSASSFPSYPQTRTVVDLYPEKGSMGGVYTGLVYSTSFRNLVVACDMPFLNAGLLRYMIDLSSDFDIVMPRIGILKEPLHAVYTKNCLHPMKTFLQEGNLRIADFPESVKARYVEQEEIDRFDPEYLSFFNVNTRGDLERARTIAAGVHYSSSATRYPEQIQPESVGV